jgi:Fe-S oxidoreductase
MIPMHPANQVYLGIPGYVFTWLIFCSALSLFLYILLRRYTLLRLGRPDPRLSHIIKRFLDLISYGFIQQRQPRYFWAGLIHIVIFWGFVVLGLRSIDLITQGMNFPVLQPFMEGELGRDYNSLKDVCELLVFIACIWAILRRAVVRPERYKESHQFEAYFVLTLIILLMLTDMSYEGSALLLMEKETIASEWLPATSLSTLLLSGASSDTLSVIHVLSYWLHILIFFFFLNFLPLSKHFHIITALPNVFLRKLTKGQIKPARWDVDDLEQLESLGIERFEDFTWKHILDFFTCTECGRCSDHCPANAIGRPLSPKMITLKLRDYGYKKVPILKRREVKEAERDRFSLVGDLISHDEIWSCTTCGACEEECPVFIEYIDKIIDMRRHLIETSQNPKAFNQVLVHLEKTGNPFGKPPAKRVDWVKDIENIPVKILEKGEEVDVLYFVDSYASYDPRTRNIASSIVKGLHRAGIDFGILGPNEKDSGHQVRRMGEEGLFQLLTEENVEVLKGYRFNKIITTDPHAFNTLKNDYPISLNVIHYSQFFQEIVERRRLKPKKALNSLDVYTYHDPCYLGRHNAIYDAPRKILQALPDLNLVEMERSRDRSFCCGGGDIILWHEIEQENVRMAEKRIQMAIDVEASVIVTACPFCLTHFEDAIKTLGLEDHIRVIDLMELLISTL